MREWADPYNSFNSWKGMAYAGHYRAIIDWMEGKGKLVAPVECNLDPVAECNLRCGFCVGQRYLRDRRDEVGMRKLPVGYIRRLVNFLAGWGVRGLCISGGGEPTLHEGLPSIIRQAVDWGMDVAVVTNGTLIGGDLAEALMMCRWVALSIDAGSAETYRKVKGRDMWDKAIAGVRKLGEMRRRTGALVDLCYKYLFLPENIGEMAQACRLARELGVQDFHARPVDVERGDIGQGKLVIDRGLLEEQAGLCHEMATADFRVHTVTHKFDAEFHVQHDFGACLATPLVLPVLTDGNCYLCVDRKMEAEFRVGSAYPDPEQILSWWGSDEHREMIEGVDVGTCSRCTWSQYNKQIERAVLKDGMCLAFP